MKTDEGKYRDLRLFFALAVLAVAMVLGQGEGMGAQGLEPNADPVRSGCEIDYPPFCIVHEDGRPDGFSVELLRAALSKMGREVTFRTGPWAEVRGWLERGEVDTLPLVGRTPEREELFDFTVPYLTMHGTIVLREETEDVHSLADLRGRRVGVMKDDNAEEFLRREDRGFKIVTAPTFADSIKDLADGHCDAVVIQRLVAVRLLKETGLTNLKLVDRPIPGFEQDFCFAVKEGDREMLSILNEGLALAVADGTHRRLHAKWFAYLELPADRPIVVGGDHNYPPFEFFDEKGRPAGFSVELTRAIAHAMNLDVSIKLGPWADMVDALREGKIDALEGMFYSLERDRVLDFSPRYLVIHCVSLMRKGEGPPPMTIEELQGRDLVVQAEDAILDALAEHGIEARITTVETQEDVVRAVANGQNACGLATRFGALRAIKKHGWTNIELGNQALYSGEYAYAVPNGNEALLAQFTEGLQIVKDSGEYRRIHEKWLGVYEPGIPAQTVLKYIALVAGPILLIAVLALVWSWSLKRRVRSRTRELQESLDRFQSVFEAANTGKSITRPTGELNVNQAFAEMLGYTRGELQGRTWQEVTPPEDVPETECRIAPILDGREDATRFEKRYLRKDGGTVWADVSVTLLRDGRGRPLHFITTVVDITERKRAAEALKRKHEMLVRTEAMAHVGSWEWEAEDDKVIWSDELFSIVGLDSADEAPPFAQQQALYVPEDYVRLARAVEECMTNGVPYTLEVRVVRVDGALRYCVLRGFPDCDADGTVTRLYGSLQDITEIRRAEERITTLSHMLDDAPASITIHNTEGRFLFANATTVSLHGYERMEEFMKINLHDLDVPESEALLAERFRRITEEGEARFEVEHYRKDGTTFPLAILAKRIEWEGRPAILSIAADITERKQAEQLIAASEEKFRLAFMTSPDSININRMSDGQYIEVNDGFLRIMGYQREKVIGRTSLELNIWKNPEDRKTLVKGLQADGYIENLSAQFCRADGTVREGLMSACVVELNGDPCILSITRDVTERKRIEEALAEQQALLTAIYRNAPLVLMVVDGDLRIQQVNGFASQFADRPVEEILRLRSGEALCCMHALDSPEGCGYGEYCSQCMIHDIVIDTLNTGKTHLQVEAPYFLLKNGETKEMTFLLSTTPLPLKDETNKVLVTLQDITERKHAEAERENLQSQLNQALKMESVGRLAGGVAHDFNNMLNVILGHTELALDDLNADNPLRDDLEEIRKAAERSANLTRQLLAFARRQTVAPKALDLNETIASMLKMLERLIGEDIDLRWSPGTRLDLVHIDPGQVDQILANLTVNARDAIGHANGKVTIETANVCLDEEYCAAHVGSKSGDYVMLAVSDDGIGMDEETREQIFEPFFTTKAMGEGTGLGLATIYGIVKQNNGFVNVYSEPDKGTTFRIYLPSYEANSKHHEDTRAYETSAVGGDETILIVEDEAAILNLTRMMLERFGYTVLTAATPAEALRTAQDQQGKIDLLITDVVMPEMNGRDLSVAIRHVYPEIRSLFMSGYTANVIAHQGVLEDGVNFIQKPFSPRDLACKVRESLDS